MQAFNDGPISMNMHSRAPPDYASPLPAYTPYAEPQQIASSGSSVARLSTTSPSVIRSPSTLASPSTIASPTSSTSPASPVISAGPFQEYEYKNGSLKLNLGQKRHGLFRPAYGWKGSIDGFVNVKNAKHVKSIVLSVEGTSTTGVSERGFMTDMTKTRVLSLTQILFDAASGQSFPTGGARYTFSLPLPSHVTGGAEPLPPTFTALQPGVEGNVTYVAKVDLTRSGMLQRNERIEAIFFYLPRTYAPVPRFTSGTEMLDDSSGWHVSAVPPKLPRDAAPTLAPPLSVSVAFPQPLEYAAGSVIPFCVTVTHGATTGALPMLFSGLTVHLVRLTTLHVGERKSLCEKVMNGGEVYRVEERGDARKMFGTVQCAKQGESTWAVGGIEVKYFVRLKLAPREDMLSLASLPTYVHKQPITLRTRERSPGSADDERQPEFDAAPRLHTVS